MPPPSTSTITRQSGDVTARELSGPLLDEVVGPARAAPPRPVEIPDGEPAAVALALLFQIHPQARAETEARVARCDADLAELVGRAGGGGIELRAFVALAGKLARLRAILRARLGRPDAPPTDVAAEVLALVRSIRPWSDGADLGREWSRRIALVRAELEGLEQDLQHAARSPTPGRGSDPNTFEHMLGLCHTTDVWLRMVTDLVERRDSARARLAALGEDLDPDARLTAAIAELLGEHASAMHADASRRALAASKPLPRPIHLKSLS